MKIYEKHKELLDRALKAIHERTFYAAYPEHPKAYGEEAPKQGEEEYKNLLNNNFSLLLQGNTNDWGGEEVSPYTMNSLGVKYPLFNVNDVIKKSKSAQKIWRKISVEERAGMLVETIEEMKKHFFSIEIGRAHV